MLHEGDLLRLGFRKDAKVHKVAFGIRLRSRTLVRSLQPVRALVPCVHLALILSVLHLILRSKSQHI